MSDFKTLVDDFLAQKRIAVAGVSSTDANAAANLIYRKLRESGYTVFPINPTALEVEGDTCYPNLKALPETVEGVVISTPPEATDKIVAECAKIGVPRVWMHRSFGQGSVSETAINFCREQNITVIPGGCPMMFCPPVDFGHKCIRWFLKMTGGLSNNRKPVAEDK